MISREWVVWYLHWRYHSSRVATSEYDSKRSAFFGAWYTEADADDCVNEVVGIEDPEGNFIDLAEWRAEWPEMERQREETQEREREERENEPKFRITVRGPSRPTGKRDGQHGDFYQTNEVWTAKYLEKYRERAVAQFGADRVTVEQILSNN